MEDDMELLELQIESVQGWDDFSFRLDGGNYFRLDRVSRSDDSSCTPVPCSSTSESIGVNSVVSLVQSNSGETALAS